MNIATYVWPNGRHHWARVRYCCGTAVHQAVDAATQLAINCCQGEESIVVAAPLCFQPSAPNNGIPIEHNKQNSNTGLTSIACRVCCRCDFKRTPGLYVYTRYRYISMCDVKLSLHLFQLRTFRVNVSTHFCQMEQVSHDVFSRSPMTKASPWFRQDIHIHDSHRLPVVSIVTISTRQFSGW